MIYALHTSPSLTATCVRTMVWSCFVNTITNIDSQSWFDQKEVGEASNMAEF